MKTNVHVWSYLAQFFPEREMLQTNAAEETITHILCSYLFPWKSCIYEIMWKNIVEPDRLHVTLWRMRIACWIPKATNTHSQYVILIVFPLQHWLHERASVLRLRTLLVLFLFALAISFSFVKGALSSPRAVQGRFGRPDKSFTFFFTLLTIYNYNWTLRKLRKINDYSKCFKVYFSSILSNVPLMFKRKISKSDY